MAYAWYSCLEPRELEPAVRDRHPGLTDAQVRAVARGVARATHFVEGAGLRNCADDAISAVASDWPEWGLLARIVLDMVAEGERLRREADSVVARGRQRTDYTETEILHGLRRLADELGRTPTVAEIDEATYLPVESALIYRWGSLQGAIRAAGLDPRPTGSRPTWSDAEMIDLLRERCRELGGSPSMRMHDERFESPLSATYRLRFGSWNDALRVAGLPERYSGARKLVPITRPIPVPASTK